MSNLQAKINEKIAEIAAVADQIPGVIVIHSWWPQFELLYMSEAGLRLLGTTWEQIKGMSQEEYHNTFFNPDDHKDYVPKLIALMEANTDEPVSFFQQVRTSPAKDFEWYLSVMRILLRNEGKPVLTITTAMRIDDNDYFTAKGARLLEEKEFFKKHYSTFQTLTTREREMLRHLALGNSVALIAEELFISPATVETHRKNLYQKLGTNNTFTVSQYARAFDLI